MQGFPPAAGSSPIPVPARRRHNRCGGTALLIFNSRHARPVVRLHKLHVPAYSTLLLPSSTPGLIHFLPARQLSQSSFLFRSRRTPFLILRTQDMPQRRAVEPGIAARNYARGIFQPPPHNCFFRSAATTAHPHRQATLLSLPVP